MLAPERHELILRSLRRHGRLRVAELVAELGVSAITVRRDLAELDEAGLLRRVHGGAVGHQPGRPGTPGESADDRHRRPERSTFYYTDVIRGAEAMADRYGARLVLGVSGYDVDDRAGADREGARDRRRRTAPQYRAAATATRTESARRLDDIDVPVVLMERAFGFPHVAARVRPCPHGSRVRRDARAAAFVSLGHRRIAINLSRPLRRTGCAGGSRKRPARLGVETYISPVRAPAHGEDPATLAQLDAFLAECESFGARAVLRPLRRAAARLVERAMERGLRVPEDLAVVVYNDVTAALAVVPLTAVCPPKFALGETACDAPAPQTRVQPGRPVTSI